MPDDPLDLDGMMDNLSRRLRRGWARLHPPTQKEMDAARNAFRQKWEQKKAKGITQTEKNTGNAQETEQSQQQGQSQTQKPKSKSNNHGQGHSH